MQRERSDLLDLSCNWYDRSPSDFGYDSSRPHLVIKVKYAFFDFPAAFSVAKMKRHVAMDGSSALISSPEAPRTLQDETHILGGIHIPKHMLSPGQDGYRTPTIQDYEVQSHIPATPVGIQACNVVATSNGSANHVSLQHHHYLHLPSVCQVHVLHKLHWSERMRHFTWTFFAINMATGGIANVLYAG